jgi:hypothetical protein
MSLYADCRRPTRLSVAQRDGLSVLAAHPTAVVSSNVNSAKRVGLEGNAVHHATLQWFQAEGWVRHSAYGTYELTEAGAIAVLHYGIVTLRELLGLPAEAEGVAS